MWDGISIRRCGMIKAVFFDIDGTLFSHRLWQVPPSAAKALHALKDKGIRLFIASGRTAGLFDVMRGHLGNFPFDGYVLSNGQVCTDRDLHPFFEQALPTQALETLIPWLAQREDIVCTFSERDRIYRNRPVADSVLLKLFPNRRNASFEILDPVRSLSHPTYQISPFIPPEMDAEFLAHAPGLKAVRWTDICADVIPADGGKPRGMQRMLDRYGILREESMAFGDGGNDIDMLRYAGIGVAMGNASQEVKDAADYTTADIDDDGVKKALEHFGLL